jgi:hypothetical protein
MEILPVAGSIIPACTKADCIGLTSWHGPISLSVAKNLYAVASPCALSGLAGTSREQFGLGASSFAACDPVRGCSSRNAPVPNAMTIVTINPTNTAGEKRFRRGERGRGKSARNF